MTRQECSGTQEWEKERGGGKACFCILFFSDVASFGREVWVFHMFESTIIGIGRHSAYQSEKGTFYRIMLQIVSNTNSKYDLFFEFHNLH